MTKETFDEIEKRVKSLPRITGRQYKVIFKLEGIVPVPLKWIDEAALGLVIDASIASGFRSPLEKIVIIPKRKKISENGNEKTSDGDRSHPESKNFPGELREQPGDN